MRTVLSDLHQDPAADTDEVPTTSSLPSASSPRLERPVRATASVTGRPSVAAKGFSAIRSGVSAVSSLFLGTRRSGDAKQPKPASPKGRRRDSGAGREASTSGAGARQARPPAAGSMTAADKRQARPARPRPQRSVETTASQTSATVSESGSPERQDSEAALTAGAGPPDQLPEQLMERLEGVERRPRVEDLDSEGRSVASESGSHTDTEIADADGDHASLASEGFESSVEDDEQSQQGFSSVTSSVNSDAEDTVVDADGHVLSPRSSRRVTFDENAPETLLFTPDDSEQTRTSDDEASHPGQERPASGGDEDDENTDRPDNFQQLLALLKERSLTPTAEQMDEATGPFQPTSHVTKFLKDLETRRHSRETDAASDAPDDGEHPHREDRRAAFPSDPTNERRGSFVEAIDEFLHYLQAVAEDHKAHQEAMVLLESERDDASDTASEGDSAWAETDSQGSADTDALASDGADTASEVGSVQTEVDSGLAASPDVLQPESELGSDDTAAQTSDHEDGRLPGSMSTEHDYSDFPSGASPHEASQQLPDPRVPETTEETQGLSQDADTEISPAETSKHPQESDAIADSKTTDGEQMPTTDDTQTQYEASNGGTPGQDMQPEPGTDGALPLVETDLEQTSAAEQNYSRGEQTTANDIDGNSGVLDDSTFRNGAVAKQLNDQERLNDYEDMAQDSEAATTTAGSPRHDNMPDIAGGAEISNAGGAEINNAEGAEMSNAEAVAPPSAADDAAGEESGGFSSDGDVLDQSRGASNYEEEHDLEELPSATQSSSSETIKAVSDDERGGSPQPALSNRAEDATASALDPAIQGESGLAPLHITNPGSHDASDPVSQDTGDTTGQENAHPQDTMGGVTRDAVDSDVQDATDPNVQDATGSQSPEADGGAQGTTEPLSKNTPESPAQGVTSIPPQDSTEPAPPEHPDGPDTRELAEAVPEESGDQSGTSADQRALRGLLLSSLPDVEVIGSQSTDALASRRSSAAAPAGEPGSQLAVPASELATRSPGQVSSLETVSKSPGEMSQQPSEAPSESELEHHEPSRSLASIADRLLREDSDDTVPRAVVSGVGPANSLAAISGHLLNDRSPAEPAPPGANDADDEERELSTVIMDVEVRNDGAEPASELGGETCAEVDDEPAADPEPGRDEPPDDDDEGLEGGTEESAASPGDGEQEQQAQSVPENGGSQAHDAEKPPLDHPAGPLKDDAETEDDGQEQGSEVSNEANLGEEEESLGVQTTSSLDIGEEGSDDTPEMVTSAELETEESRRKTVDHEAQVGITSEHSKTGGNVTDHEESSAPAESDIDDYKAREEAMLLLDSELEIYVTMEGGTENDQALKRLGDKKQVTKVDSTNAEETRPLSSPNDYFYEGEDNEQHETTPTLSDHAPPAVQATSDSTGSSTLPVTGAEHHTYREVMSGTRKADNVDNAQEDTSKSPENQLNTTLGSDTAELKRTGSDSSVFSDLRSDVSEYATGSEIDPLYDNDGDIDQYSGNEHTFPNLPQTEITADQAYADTMDESRLIGYDDDFEEETRASLGIQQKTSSAKKIVWSLLAMASGIVRQVHGSQSEMSTTRDDDASSNKGAEPYLQESAQKSSTEDAKVATEEVTLTETPHKMLPSMCEIVYDEINKEANRTSIPMNTLKEMHQDAINKIIQDAHSQIIKAAQSLVVNVVHASSERLIKVRRHEDDFTKNDGQKTSEEVQSFPSDEENSLKRNDALVSSNQNVPPKHANEKTSRSRSRQNNEIDALQSGKVREEGKLLPTGRPSDVHTLKQDNLQNLIFEQPQNVDDERDPPRPQDIANVAVAITQSVLDTATRIAENEENSQRASRVRASILHFKEGDRSRSKLKDSQKVKKMSDVEETGEDSDFPSDEDQGAPEPPDENQNDPVSSDEGQETLKPPDDDQDALVASVEDQDAPMPPDEDHDALVPPDEGQDTAMPLDKDQDTPEAPNVNTDSQLPPDEERDTQLPPEETSDSELHADGGEDFASPPGEDAGLQSPLQDGEVAAPVEEVSSNADPDAATPGEGTGEDDTGGGDSEQPQSMGHLDPNEPGPEDQDYLSAGADSAPPEPALEDQDDGAAAMDSSQTDVQDQDDTGEALEQPADLPQSETEDAEPEDIAKTDEEQSPTSAEDETLTSGSFAESGESVNAVDQGLDTYDATRIRYEMGEIADQTQNVVSADPITSEMLNTEPEEGAVTVETDVAGEENAKEAADDDFPMEDSVEGVDALASEPGMTDEMPQDDETPQSQQDVIGEDQDLAGDAVGGSGEDFPVSDSLAGQDIGNLEEAIADFQDSTATLGDSTLAFDDGVTVSVVNVDGRDDPVNAILAEASQSEQHSGLLPPSSLKRESSWMEKDIVAPDLLTLKHSGSSVEERDAFAKKSADSVKDEESPYDPDADLDQILASLPTGEEEEEEVVEYEEEVQELVDSEETETTESESSTGSSDTLKEEDGAADTTEDNVFDWLRRVSTQMDEMGITEKLKEKYGEVPSREIILDNPKDSNEVPTETPSVKIAFSDTGMYHEQSLSLEDAYRIRQSSTQTDVQDDEQLGRARTDPAADGGSRRRVPCGCCPCCLAMKQVMGGGRASPRRQRPPQQRSQPQRPWTSPTRSVGDLLDDTSSVTVSTGTASSEDGGDAYQRRMRNPKKWLKEAADEFMRRECIRQVVLKNDLVADGCTRTKVTRISRHPSSLSDCMASCSGRVPAAQSLQMEISKGATVVDGRTVNYQDVKIRTPKACSGPPSRARRASPGRSGQRSPCGEPRGDPAKRFIDTYLGKTQSESRRECQGPKTRKKITIRTDCRK